MSVINLNINSIDDLNEAAQGADFEPRQLSATDIRGALSYVDVDGIIFSTGRFFGDVELQGPLSPDHLTLGLLLHAAEPSRQWFREISAQEVGVFPAGKEQHAFYHKDTTYATFTLPEDEVLKHAELENIAIDRQQLITPGMAGISRPTWEISQKIAHIAHNNPRYLSEPDLVQELRCQILDSFVATFWTYGNSQAIYEPYLHKPETIVKDALAIVQRHSNLPVTVNKLCTLLEIPRRSLHRAFLSVIGVPPAEYLRLFRLNGVRQTLIRLAHRKETSVTEVAMDWGFWSLGHFSVGYRRIFGESPSTTLAIARR